MGNFLSSESTLLYSIIRLCRRCVPYAQFFTNCIISIPVSAPVMKAVKNLIYVSGQRGSPKLVVQGYSFIRNKGNKTTTYWRCSRAKMKNCKAKVVTNRDSNKICLTNPEHNHPPDFSQFIDDWMEKWIFFSILDESVHANNMMILLNCRPGSNDH